MGKGILIVGSLNMDIVVEMTKMPELGETVMGKHLSYIPGGKGANQACAAGKLGGHVTMLGCVGNDNFGTRQIQLLKESHVCMEYVDVRQEEPTGTAVIYVDGTGANSIVVIPGANACCDIQYLKEHDELFQNCSYAMFQMEIPKEAVYYGIARAKELGKTTILNPAPAPEALPEEIWDKIDFFTPNETELAKLAGLKEMDERSIRRGARKILAKGVKQVLVTMGSKGVLWVNDKTEQIFPARKVEAVDTTAAGDCFNGAFVTALQQGYSIEDAITFANLASSIVVTRKGAQSSIPERDEVYSICGAN